MMGWQTDRTTGEICLQNENAVKDRATLFTLGQVNSLFISLVHTLLIIDCVRLPHSGILSSIVCEYTYLRTGTLDFETNLLICEKISSKHISTK